MATNVSHPLLDLLDLAVPLALADLQRRGGPSATDLEVAPGLAQDLAAHGDVLLFASAPGATAALFGRLVQALAMLATWPGGVSLGGRHWEVLPCSD